MMRGVGPRVMEIAPMAGIFFAVFEATRGRMRDVLGAGAEGN